MRVVKLGGRAQEDPSLPAAIARAWDATPGSLCLVHGGGDQVTRLQRALGVEPAFRNGRRVTTAADVELIRMALSGGANKRLVSALVSAGAPAIGLSGEDGGLITARVLDPALGRVGTPVGVNAALLRLLLAAGLLPVLSPLAREAAADQGAPLNVNGDDAAAAIAAALGAGELLFVSDVDGVIVDGATASALGPARAAALIASGTATGGMVAKLEAAERALAMGVTRVRIGGAEMLVDAAAGTTIAAERAAA